MLSPQSAIPKSLTVNMKQQIEMRAIEKTTEMEEEAFMKVYIYN